MKTAHAAFERHVVAKVTRRLVPLMFLLYLFACLDRASIGFAGLQMSRDLGLGDGAYGVAAGVFFLGYFLFEIPSNLLLERIGARRWLSSLAIVWGLIATATMLVRTAADLTLARFLLGLAEAGLFPGLILTCMSWFPDAARGRAMALFMGAGSISWIIGGPVAGALLTMDRLAGLAGWQWVFLVEGFPAVVLGVIGFFVLTNSPEQAHWLTPEEREWLGARLRREQAAATPRVRRHYRQTVASKAVWTLAAIHFLTVYGSLGLNLWLPRIVKGVSGLSDTWAGLLTAVPHAAGAAGLVAVGIHSDRMNERRWHVIAAGMIAAIGLLLTARARDPITAVAAASVAAFGMSGLSSPFWAMATSLLGGPTAAGAIALVNSLGCLGGFVGPSLVGWARDGSQSHTGGLSFLALAFLLQALLVRGLTTPQEGEIPGTAAGSGSGRE